MFKRRSHSDSQDLSATRRSTLGGVVHTYQKYDPAKFPSPTSPPPDFISRAFDHALMYGSYRELTEEELARAVELDPSQIAGLGPSIEQLRQMLEERKRKILAKYETRTLDKKASRTFKKSSEKAKPPKRMQGIYEQAVNEEQIYLLERIYYQVGDDTDRFAGQLVHVIDALSNKYQIDELVSKYHFTGSEKMTIPQAIEIKEELETIDELLKQLDEASQKRPDRHHRHGETCAVCVE